MNVTMARNKLLSMIKPADSCRIITQARCYACHYVMSRNPLGKLYNIHKISNCDIIIYDTCDDIMKYDVQQIPIDEQYVIDHTDIMFSLYIRARLSMVFQFVRHDAEWVFEGWNTSRRCSYCSKYTRVNELLDEDCNQIYVCDGCAEYIDKTSELIESHCALASVITTHSDINLCIFTMFARAVCINSDIYIRSHINNSG